METTNKPYSILNLTQGSEEWLSFRRSRIGSSDISTLMGVNPYQSQKKLMRLKLGEVERINYYTANLFQQGHEIEEQIRTRLVETMGFDLKNPVVVSKENDLFFASLDLFDEKNGFLGEVKSTESQEILTQVQLREVPAMYSCQMNWAMGITGISVCNLYVVDRSTGNCFHIEHKFNEKFFNSQKDAAATFLSTLATMAASSSCPLPEITALENVAAAIKKIKRVSEVLKSYEERVKLEAERLLGDKPFLKGAGISIERSERKGSIAYAAIPELKNVDLERYRKPTTTFVTIREEKTKKETTNDKRISDSK